MMQKSVNADWNSFMQHIGLLYPEQINNLKKLTRNHLEASNDEQKARFIKVVYVDHYDEPLSPSSNDQKKTPRVVLWEAHPAVRVPMGRKTHATTIDILKKSLRDVYLPANLSHLQAQFYFASTPLRDPRVYDDRENLWQYLVFYCDKIYAKPFPESINDTWQKYKDYFKKAQDMVLAKPRLYTELCRYLKRLFDSPGRDVLEDDVYRCLVLLRSLPESLAYAPNNGHEAAAASVRELLGLLDVLEGKESKVGNKVTIYEEVIYNVINALEWLAYLVPKMFEVRLQGPPLYKDFVVCLEKYITEKRYKLAIRLEAACALGWASVSSIAIATYVHESKKSPKSRIYMLNSNVLRQVVGIAYLRASFTLASFGPARVTPGAEKMALPGGHVPVQKLPEDLVVTSKARQAVSDVVSNELASMVGGGIQFLSILTALAVFWLFVNTLITTLLLQDPHLAVVAALLIPPTILLLVTIIILSVRWGRGYWRGIAISWVAFVALAVSPWVGVANGQHIFVILGTFAALVLASLGPISSWVTLIAGIPPLILATLKWVRSRFQRR